MKLNRNILVYKFDDEILKSLSEGEIEILLMSIKNNYNFYDEFKKGHPVKFDMHPNKMEVRIHMGYNNVWTWCNHFIKAIYQL